MSRTDIIADMLTLIRNANMIKMEKVDVPCSKINKEILAVLKKEGFIQNFKSLDEEARGIVRVYLRFSKDKTKSPAITNLKRVSKPGLRVYSKTKSIPRVLRGSGIAVVSTSKGILTDKE